MATLTSISIDPPNPGTPNVGNTINVFGSSFVPGESIQLAGVYHGCTDQSITFPSVTADGNGTFAALSNNFFPSWPQRSADPITGPITIINAITVTATTLTSSVTNTIDVQLFDGQFPAIETQTVFTTCGTDTLINFTAQANSSGLAEMSVQLPAWLAPVPPGVLLLCDNVTTPNTFGTMINFTAPGTFVLTAKAISNAGRSSTADFNVVVTGDPIWTIAFDQPSAVCPLTDLSYNLVGNCFPIGSHTINFTWTDCRGPQTASVTVNSTDGSIALQGQLSVAWASPLVIGTQVDLAPIQSTTITLTDSVAPTASLTPLAIQSGVNNLCISAHDLGSGVARVKLTGPNLAFDHVFPCPSCDALVCFPQTITSTTTYTLEAFDQSGNSFSQQVTLKIGQKFFNRTVYAACGQPGQRVGFRQRIDYDPPSNSIFPLGKTLVIAKKRGKVIGQFYVIVKRSIRC